MTSYPTVTQAVEALRKRGYRHDFNIAGGCLYCNQVNLDPSDFTIDEIHRVEGQTDPGDQMIVFAIASSQHDLKGILVNAYGVYANQEASEVVKKLSMSK